MASFQQICREVVTWVRVPRPTPGASTPSVLQTDTAVHPTAHLHSYPDASGSPLPHHGRLHRIGQRLHHAGMKKVVVLACTFTGGIAGASLIIDKVALRVPAKQPGLSPTPVSEPSSFYLLAFGVAALWLSLYWIHRKTHPAAQHTGS